MEELTPKLKEIALKHAKALALDLVAECAIPAIELAVAKSENKIDDVVLAAIKEPVKKELLALIEKI